MLCPNCKRGVISYYQFCPWCGTDVQKSVGDFVIEKGQDVTIYAGNTKICEINGKRNPWKLVLTEAEAE